MLRLIAVWMMSNAGGGEPPSNGMASMAFSRSRCSRMRDRTRVSLYFRNVSVCVDRRDSRRSWVPSSPYCRASFMCVWSERSKASHVIDASRLSYSSVEFLVRDGEFFTTRRGISRLGTPPMEHYTQVKLTNPIVHANVYDYHDFLDMEGFSELKAAHRKWYDSWDKYYKPQPSMQANTLLCKAMSCRLTKEWPRM